MASSNDVYCGVCDSQHITTPASNWCPECDEGLCQACLKHHNASKATRSHGIIPIDNFKQLPPSIVNISQYCKEHDRKFQLYCLQHDSPCCPLCVSSNHKACTEMQAIEELLKTAKTSTKLESLEQSLEVITTHLKMAIGDRQDNLTNIKEQSEKIKSEVEQLRNQINSHLDKLEENILKDLLKTESQVTSEIETFMKRLEDEEQKVNDFHTQIKAMKQFATDLQTFLVTRDLENKLQNEIKFIESFGKEQNLKQVELSFNANTDMEAKIDRFGSILPKYRDSSVNFRTVDKICAQKLTSTTPLIHNTFESTILTLEKKLNYPYEHVNIFGCAVFQNGNVLLADDKRIIVMRQDGTLDKEINVSPHDPYDVTCVDDDLFAFSCWQKSEIHVVSMVNKQIQRTIQTDKPCEGITHSIGNIIFCENERGIRTINLVSNHSAYLAKTTISNGSYVTILQDTIYHSNGGTVKCYTVNGTKKWEFKDKAVLTYPRGIAVDSNYNVYVRDEKRGVVLVSPDGKQARTMLTQNDCVNEGNAMCFDRQRNKLLVANKDSGFLVFKVS